MCNLRFLHSFTFAYLLIFQDILVKMLRHYALWNPFERLSNPETTDFDAALNAKVIVDRSSIVITCNSILCGISKVLVTMSLLIVTWNRLYYEGHFTSELKVRVQETGPLVPTIRYIVPEVLVVVVFILEGFKGGGPAVCIKDKSEIVNLGFASPGLINIYPRGQERFGKWMSSKPKHDITERGAESSRALSNGTLGPGIGSRDHWNSLREMGAALAKRKLSAVSLTAITELFNMISIELLGSGTRAPRLRLPQPI
ncbi:hypothetical protein DL96DRAFT_1782340 [Flagelloscypha sp. PMI_526]|nr:hypothetical protein DL96DRAFT_1782340 [Flagelloscypha sp. PMI_526]